MNEMELKNINEVPPGGFRYKHPVTGQEFSRHTWGLCRMDVTAYCEANGFPPVTDAEIHQQMCESYGPKLAKQLCRGDGVTVQGVSLSWRDIWHGTKVLASFIAGGRKTVERAEAERRAAICEPCSRNVNYSKPCGGDCEELASLVVSIVGGEGTTKDINLNACSVCSCSNKAQVWMPIEHLEKGVTPEMMPMFPSFCWKKAEIEALRDENG